MAGAERLLRDGQRALEQRLGLRVAALPFVKCGQIVQGDSHFGVIRPQSFLLDGQGLL